MLQQILANVAEGASQTLLDSDLVRRAYLGI